MNINKDQQNYTILIKLFQEDSQLVSYYNLMSYFRGIYELIDQYGARNNLSDQDRCEMDNRLHTLPPPKHHEDRVYTVDFLLMTQCDRSTLETPFTVVRISLNDDLNVEYFQIIAHGKDTVLFEYNFKDYKYPANIGTAISARTLDLYNGLSLFYDKAVINGYQTDIMVTYYCSTLLISEASRSELVRTFILQQNLITVEDRESQHIQPEKWMRLKKSFNWQQKITLCPIFNRMDSIHLFGSSTQLFLYLIKLRFIKKTRRITDMDIVEACKEFVNFHKSQSHQSENEDEDPPFKKFNDILGRSISIYHKYEFVATYSEDDDDRVSSRNPRKKAIDADIKKVKEKLMGRCYLFKTMAEEFDGSEYYKKKIKQNYNVDLNDDDMRTVSENFHHVDAEVLRKDIAKSASNKMALSFIIHTTRAIGKRIPFLSIGFGAWSAVECLLERDYGGAVVEFVSGFGHSDPVTKLALSNFEMSNEIKAFFKEKPENQKKATIIPNEKYHRFVTNICDEIKQMETELTNLIIQDEREKMGNWMADPKSRFLKPSDKYDDYYFLL